MTKTAPITLAMVANDGAHFGALSAAHACAARAKPARATTGVSAAAVKHSA